MKAALALLLLLAHPVEASIDTAAIDAYVQSRLDAHRVPGAALVVMQGEAVLHAQAFGSAGGGTAMTVDTPLLIGSLSKAFTATAVLQLVDEGKLALDAPVQQYLPEFQLADPQAAATITVRQLLNQTSGMPTGAPRAAQSPATLLDHVRALAQTRLVAPPGQQHVYSSPNYQVLGLLVERVSTLPFDRYLQDRIFKPLGMDHSYTDAAAARAAGLGRGHSLWFGLAVASPYQQEPDRLPTASIITSARDLGRFAAAHLGAGPQLLSAASLQVAHQGVGDGGSFRYAMGWRDGTTAGLPSLWHGGALPAYRGAVVLLPDRGQAVVLLSNSASMFADHTREIVSGVVALLDHRQPPEPGRALGLTYLYIALGSALLLALGLRDLVRAVRGRGRRTALAPALLFNVAAPLALALGLPWWTGIPWPAMYANAPDLTTTVAVLIVLSLLTALFKLRPIRTR